MVQQRDVPKTNEEQLCEQEVVTVLSVLQVIKTLYLSHRLNEIIGPHLLCNAGVNVFHSILVSLTA